MAMKSSNAADNSLRIKTFMATGPSLVALLPEGLPVPKAHRAQATAPAADGIPRMT
eukprot:CAMPEP_0180506400 /NCGR_PEP_ID=MMETSP1036_2-20121128/47958_1 /TAXON_ID=632150 /ORGANISM="Azadinium spinosum, Strain 3D9" /LENGTH=55 /DNA_ID=CAMNT_0022516317 /DNA_START=113 /DNA_END=280 /DNA_ORIENTATION=+